MVLFMGSRLAEFYSTGFVTARQLSPLLHDDLGCGTLARCCSAVFCGHQWQHPWFALLGNALRRDIVKGLIHGDF